MKKLSGFLSAIFLFCFFGFANAAYIDNVEYTTDTQTGLDWLDLTQTREMSYNDVLGDIDLSNNGWMFATVDQFVELVNGYFEIDFNGIPRIYWPLNDTYSSLVEDFIGLFGDTYDEFTDIYARTYDFPYPGKGMTIGTIPILDESGEPTSYMMGRISDYERIIRATGELDTDREDFIDLYYRHSTTTADTIDGATGYWLVRQTSVVPIPSAVWLLGSGLIGLLGFRRKFRKA